METINTDEDGSVHLQIVELQRLSEAYGLNNTMFEPHSGIDKRDSSTANSVAPSGVPAPEKKLTLFALRLAIFEKAATGLGTLSFIWATVVLLGGFAITLDKTDFWFITVILLIEGTRIFSRSHELEWQHQATWSITDAGINSFRALRSSSHLLVERVKTMFSGTIDRVQKQRSRHTREIGNSPNVAGRISANIRDCQTTETRTWTNSDVPLFPFAPWIFLSRNISKLLYWLQLVSAMTCVVLSLLKLIRHDYGEIAKGDTDKRNRKAALNIFYALALAEATLFLIEKAYWEWKLTSCRLLEEVNRESEFGPLGIISIKRFFYDAYSRCINGSIFDGLKMDMVSFGIELLGSNSPDEQLIGVRILRSFSMNERFSDDTLQKIGTNMGVIERLVEMLNWTDPQEEEIRRSAAEILAVLAGCRQNSLRVTGIPGAMESISSLLQVSRSSNIAADEIGEKKNIFDNANYSFWTFNHLGLLILKKLAHDHDNCTKIGNTRGLLPKTIDFTHADERIMKDDNCTESQIMTVKRSLQVVKMLASTTGLTGKNLRREISEIVFTISNIRDILRHGEKHPDLQRLGIDILTNLALEQEATERIGGTGGMLKELFRIFFNDSLPSTQNHVKIAAGEALAMLALESKANCHRILRLNVLARLVEAIHVHHLRINAARILRNLCIYSGPDKLHQLKGITASAPAVLTVIMTEENKLQEVMAGLAVEAFKLMTHEESTAMLEMIGAEEHELANIIVRILRRYENPTAKVPRIRRFAIELAIWMMRCNEANKEVFDELGLEQQLEIVLESTSELESFDMFSGTVGLSRHCTSIHSLVETALKLLTDT